MSKLVEDITANRHGGNEASAAANEKVDKEVGREKVISAFRELDGVSYSKQIARYLNKPLNAISGRISELKVLGIIVSAGLGRTEGCEILKLKEKNS